MEERKKLSGWEKGILVFDVLIALFDTGLATYHFIQGRWLNGIFLIAATALLMWSAIGLLKSKHELEKMRMGHEFIMETLKYVDERVEGEKN